MRLLYTFTTVVFAFFAIAQAIKVPNDQQSIAASIPTRLLPNPIIASAIKLPNLNSASLQQHPNKRLSKQLKRNVLTNNGNQEEIDSIFDTISSAFGNAFDFFGGGSNEQQANGNVEMSNNQVTLDNTIAETDATGQTSAANALVNDKFASTTKPQMEQMRNVLTRWIHGHVESEGDEGISKDSLIVAMNTTLFEITGNQLNDYAIERTNQQFEQADKDADGFVKGSTEENELLSQLHLSEASDKMRSQKSLTKQLLKAWIDSRHVAGLSINVDALIEKMNSITQDVLGKKLGNTDKSRIELIFTSADHDNDGHLMYNEEVDELIKMLKLAT